MIVYPDTDVRKPRWKYITGAYAEELVKFPLKIQRNGGISFRSENSCLPDPGPPPIVEALWFEGWLYHREDGYPSFVAITPTDDPAWPRA